MKKFNGPKTLYLDIETAPILASVWGLWKNDVSLNQIEKDWYILSFAAKWAHQDKVFYYDQRNVKNIENDKELLKKAWKLLDEADVVVWQNGDKFDGKKLNSRFILNKMTPPSSFKTIDTLKIAKKYFGFTSNKLEYLSKNINNKYKKLDHKQFPGQLLWKECLAGNKVAWKEMELYNKHDVLALEEVHKNLAPWDNSVNYNLYHDSEVTYCSCGSTEFYNNGHFYGASGKYKRYKCKKCGSEVRSRKNEYSKEKRDSLKTKTK